MDLVRLGVTGGLALASVLTLLSTARQGNADALARPAASSPVLVQTSNIAPSPVAVEPTAPRSVVRLPNAPAFGGLFLLPATPASTRPSTFDERWRSGPTVWNVYIEEASRRFGVPMSWIRSVMQAESAGQQFLNGVPITSPKGAMGLMQVMPATYSELRVRYGLGPDPYDPRDNVLAGTAYIREMYDRFGAPGFLAAYNAGPGRAGDWLSRGRPLPDETRRYVADVAPRVAAPSWDSGGASAVRVAGPVQDLTGLALLPRGVTRRDRAPVLPAEVPIFTGSNSRASTESQQSAAPRNDGLFVVLGGDDRRRVRAAEDELKN